MRHTGFTLLEAVVVLGLVAGFALIPLTQFGPLRQHYTEQIFFNSFDQEWRELQARALLNQEHTQIQFYADQITFRAFVGKQRVATRTLALPAGMVVDTQDIFIDPPGHMGPREIQFNSHYFGHTTVIKPQMGWGIYE
ncbi:hypothetical protein [Loigolactobacillus binensis]|uniref:Prepilin-type N-terminal cleavage/methylation domain-containing protein n=1 Tax=Loigolactobacillus binensis TaxID=2559922 RepID=A0ABW3EFR0_9LACO|nr:hypothetical protein [Loigolactobacillus binensis]